jgi:hypothetical protein
MQEKERVPKRASMVMVVLNAETLSEMTHQISPAVLVQDAGS